VSQIADGISPVAKTDQDKAGFGLFLMNAVKLTFEKVGVVELTEVGFWKPQLIDVVPDAAEVSDITGVQAVDHEDVHAIAATFVDILAGRGAFGGRLIDTVHKAQAATCGGAENRLTTPP
jgi:hypothetical protein